MTGATMRAPELVQNRFWWAAVSVRGAPTIRLYGTLKARSVSVTNRLRRSALPRWGGGKVRAGGAGPSRLIHGVTLVFLAMSALRVVRALCSALS